MGVPDGSWRENMSQSFLLSGLTLLFAHLPIIVNHSTIRRMYFDPCVPSISIVTRGSFSSGYAEGGAGADPDRRRGEEARP